MSQKVFTFLHLSNIHFHRWSGDHYDLDEDLRSQLEVDVDCIRKELGSDFDAILVTGDIAFSGQAGEYETAAKWLNKLCTDLECKPENVWVTPGNHDFDRQCVAESPGLRDLHAKIRVVKAEDVATVVGKYCRDEVFGPGLFKPLEQYNKFAVHFGCDIHNKRPYWETDGLMHFYDGTELRIRGMNSVLVSSREDRARDEKEPGNLLLGGFQVPTEVPGAEYLTLCHHPPNWLRDESQVDSLLNRRARIQLFGHTHEHQVKHDDGVLRLVAGALHPEREQETWLPRYNVLQIGVDNTKQERIMSVEIYPRIWEKHKFSSDGSQELAVTRIEINLDERYSERAPFSSEESEMTRSDDAEFAKKAAEPSSKTVEMREAAYRYLRLPYYERVRIAQVLRLLEEGDENVPDMVKFKRVLARVVERHALDDFFAQIKNTEKAVG